MMRRVTLHCEQEGGYWAECPSLPGCISQGETWDEVVSNINETFKDGELLSTENEILFILV